MDFGALPPEINSALMYAGAGAGPMMAAAAAWNGLAAELTQTLETYQTVTTTLTGGAWMGESATAMNTAVAPHLQWLSATAAAAEQAAAQAQASAAAFQAAFAATVPPQMVIANRTQLAALVATNFLGINAAAIAATEAHYAEMWAQDAAAMYGYAGAAATAGMLQPMQMPTDVANPLGANGLVAQAGSGAHNSLTDLITSLPNTLQSLAGSGASSAIPSVDPTSYLQNVLGTAGNVGAWNMFAGIAAGVGLAQAHSAEALVSSTSGAAGTGVLAGATAPAAAAPAVTVRYSGGAPVSAGLGSAAPVGKLSVPANWPGATTAVGSGSAPLITSEWVAGTAAEESGAMSAVPAGLGGAGRAGRVGLGMSNPHYGFKPTVIARPVAAG